MAASVHTIEVNGISIELVRKNIKRINLTVYPAAGRVRLAVPLRVDDAAARAFVLQKMAWIQRQQQKIHAQPGRVPHQFSSGEEHLFQGRAYRLKVIEHSGPVRVALGRETLDLYVGPGSTPAEREQALLGWYRAELRAAIPPLIAKWERVMGVQVADWGIRRMRTRWGSCSLRARRIWISLELARKSPRCLEYIVVHEMTHLLERLHNRRFYSLLTQFLPEWKSIREELNRQPALLQMKKD